MDPEIITVRDRGADVSAMVTLVLLTFAGLVPVLAALAEGRAFGAGETIGLMLIALGVWGTVREIIDGPPEGADHAGT